MPHYGNGFRVFGHDVVEGPASQDDPRIRVIGVVAGVDEDPAHDICNLTVEGVVFFAIGAGAPIRIDTPDIKHGIFGMTVRGPARAFTRILGSATKQQDADDFSGKPKVSP